MLTNLSLRELLERRAQIPDASPASSFSTETHPVVLRRLKGPFVAAISIFKRLIKAGLRGRAAKDAVDELAAHDRAIIEIPVDVDLAALAADLLLLGVTLHLRQTFEDPAGTIAEVRSRHGLSQSAFANALGLDVRTLQNWEQGRNRPDAAALTLVLLYDRAPDLVTDVVFGSSP
jgi:DNA-binding transcriptional regulator YiaG